MACAPCQKKALERQKAAAEARVAASPYSRSVVKDINVGCNKMRDSLTLLDKQIVAIYKKNGKVGNGIAPEALRKQRLLRTWMSELSVHCPPDNELADLRKWIQDHND